MNSDTALHNLGEAIFNDINENLFLNELYDSILHNYAIVKFGLQSKRQMQEIDITSALRFADLLSKSNHPEKRDEHRMWAQEIIILLNELYPENEDIRFYAGSVFSNTGNYQARKIIESDYSGTTALDRYFAEFQSDYLTIPAAPEFRFFEAQKRAYDHLKDNKFSYSGPTSMGKSFIMRMFIKDQIRHGVELNFALIVPTKALINEIYKQIIDEDLKGLLSEFDYKVVTAAGDIALEGSHNLILVLTPERLLYLLISRPDLRIDYLFIDEAHKLSGKNSRGPFYYKVVDMLLKRDHRPHFVFASPNIPNPEVYLKLLTDLEDKGGENNLRTTFSPVTQVKFSIDLNNNRICVFNNHNGELEWVADIKNENTDLIRILWFFENINRQKPFEKREQTIVYCNGKAKAVEWALRFAELLPEIQDDDLMALSRDITSEVHGDYYLAKIIKRGVAYHIGYLPAAIRMRLENMFRRGKITTMFCTSTLLEGVNLPADNLFITDNKISRRIMSPVDFKNLIGRVGRISFNLYGNVFLVSQGDRITQEAYLDLLKKDIPEQKLSIETGAMNLSKAEKEYVVKALLSGNIEMVKTAANKNEESYVMMRKFGLILLRDIMQDNQSLVRKEFSGILSPKDEVKIKELFSDPYTEPDDDINTSVDQTKNLRAAIAMGLKYPDRVNGAFVYDDVLDFLEKLSRIFKWGKYEETTLGKPSLLRWYAVVLIQWMSGSGLSSIMAKALEHHQRNPENFWINRNQKDVYDDSVAHRNIVFADTLEVIDNIILFSISNYFLRFSNEYKTVNHVEEFDNNWYEYVEYGTTNSITILLQRNGFSREASTYIRNHREYIKYLDNKEWRLSTALLSCSNDNVRTEAASVKYNMPELFEKMEQ